MRSLLFLESQARARLERARDAAAEAPAREHAARTLQRIPLFDAPRAPALHGFAFLEFGVDDPAAEALGALLVPTRLQARRPTPHEGGHALSAGRHPACRQRRAGVAGAHPLRRPGAGGLRHRPGDERPAAGGQPRRRAAVGAAREPAWRARAAAAGDHRARRDDRPFRARGRGAALDADFVTAAGDAPSADAGLVAIDHIALGLAQDQFDTWILFAKAVLGLERGESLELADPFGLIRSSGVANAERSVRMVLNVSLSQRTRTARQVSATGRSGGGVQHIALGTDDIFATMARLREDGVRFVPISANYYDDLLARLDLDEATVRRMQSLDILYDRSPSGGEFLHAYAEPFADRFFFEIVQRRAYDGYGAVNAPARMAAQEQNAKDKA
jgi:4-hydroxyphenylpyruvate dioxygenase